MDALLILATVAVYGLPDVVPVRDPAWLQYILHGLLGALLACCLALGVRIRRLSAVCIAMWEGATSVCGGLYGVESPAFGSLCDNGTGLPVTFPFVAVTIAALLNATRRRDA